MKRFLLFIVFAAGVPGVHAQNTGNIAGTWSGKADVGVFSLRLVFHIEQDGDRYSATMDSPDQGVLGIPVTSASFARDTLRIEVGSIGLSYAGVLRGDRIEGSFAQRGSIFPLALERGEIALNRPQTPVAPFPYRSEDVVFENTQAGITLAGTLTMPEKGRRFPAVVLLTGSGQQNRDEELFEHKPFLVLADYLTRHGIAVLRFDDRGTGESGGDPQAATTADFAGDAAAAVEYLKGRREIDRRKIGLAGHSEGGNIAFIAADHPSEVAFVVSMMGAGVRGDSILVMQLEDVLRSRGMSDQAVKLAAVQQRRSIGQAVESSPWMRFFVEHDPADDISRVKCPVLAIGGGKDLQVRSSVNLAAIRAALERGGNTRATLVEYPDLNHLLQATETGRIEEYGELEETISSRVLEDITAWILRITK